MSERIPSVEELRRIAAAPHPSMHVKDWTLQIGLGVVRESRRRHAADAHAAGLDEWCARLAGEIVEHTGVDPTTAATVLLFAASRIGAALDGPSQLPGAMFMLNVLACTADDIARKAPEEGGGS
ncbi:hypothetical protein [Streptomyces sp. DH37]|uniref:hypothetical protein n=1 Tax=Streptomyces sp. DH37 TaxID=3040122 RepID=UPI0024435213|nr:hypothetical protein [Streptomyces sp. DH37]MDG9703737.1 hypothetical protein [Streptomyces sp. DH37]